GGDPGAGGSAYASEGVLKPGSGGGGGSAGQSGNIGAGGSGGSGGGAVLLNAWNIYINGRIIANGTNGGNGNNGDRPGAGGGGGSGGCILIQGCNVTIGANAELNASGGNGGNAGDDTSESNPDDEAGGGGGGGGGAIWIYADNAYLEENGAIFNVSGGAGGLGSVGASPPLNNNGANGAAGNIIKPTSSTPPNPRTSFTSGFSYSSTGYYESPVYDAGRIAFWQQITWTHDTHWSGTKAEILVRCANDTESLSTTPWSSIATYGGLGVSTTTETLSSSFFARFFQYNITLTTTLPENSPTVYSVFLTYHKPKLLIANITFNPHSIITPDHKVTLYNNDTMPLTYSNLYLNASGSLSSHSTGEITLEPGQWLEISLGTGFFQAVEKSGDFLFLNDTTSGISGNAPNGIIDFVNWTDIKGNPPPSDGGIAAANLEWRNGPVDLSGFDITTDEGINRTQSAGVPVDTDVKEDWVITTEQGFIVLLVAPLLLVTLHHRRKRKRVTLIYQ
ncbi:MAG: hypothetical protein QW115_00680, partial [Thermoplasmata archaeon]